MAINFPDPSQQTTYVADSGVTYEFIDGVWKATTFAGLGDVRYVNITGDDMTGNLTIATDKILLNTDGSAEFANKITCGSTTRRGQFEGICPSSVTAAAADAFAARYDGTTVAQIKYDGSAAFADNVSVDKYLTVTNSALSSDSRVQIQGDNDVAISVYPVTGGARTIELKHDGSADFAGTVDANALTVNGAAVDTSAQVDAKIAAIPPTDLSAYDTSAEVTAKVAALETSLTDGAPGALDTLNELAASLGDDSNFAGTVTNSLAGKADLTGATFTGDVTASAFIGDGSQLTGVGSETIISSTPPTPADYEVGTMWWNSDSTDTSLYILYQDPTGPNGDPGGKYWIEAAPAPDSIGFDGTHTGDSTFTGNMSVTGTATFAGNLNVSGFVRGGANSKVYIGDDIELTTGKSLMLGGANTKISNDGIACTVDIFSTERLRINDGKVSINSGAIDLNYTGSAEFAGTIATNQGLLVGTSTSRSIGAGAAYPARLQVESSGFTNTSFTQNSNDIYGPEVNLGKSRGTSAGGTTIVQSGDQLGIIQFAGADGTDLETNAAAIECRVDGTPGSNDMPGRLVFLTTSDSQSNPTERMVIDSAGRLLLNGGTDVRMEFGTTGTSGTNDRNHIRGDGSSLKYNTCSGGFHIFEQNGIEAMRIGASGSATFASDVTLGQNLTGGYALKIKAEGNSGNVGGIYLTTNPSSSAQTALLVRDLATNKDTVTISTDGSATFAGGVYANYFSALTDSGSFNFYRSKGAAGDLNSAWGVENGTQTIQFYNNGSATFGPLNISSSTGYGAQVDMAANAATIKAQCQQTASQYTELFAGYMGTNKHFHVLADGSATFAGDVVRGTYAANANYCALRDGQLEIGRNTNDGNLTLIKGTRYNGATTYDTFNFKADGSATFAGTVSSGGLNLSDTDASGVEVRSSGEVLIQRSSAQSTSGVLDVRLGSTQTANILANGSATFNGNLSIKTSTGASTSIFLSNDGDASFTGHITAGNVSDIKFKENITDAKPQLPDVTALGGMLKNWDWKDEAPLNEELRAKRFLGLVAQEAETICPGIVYDVQKTSEEGKEDESVETYKAINHEILVMKLLGAVSELSAKVEALEAK